MFGLKNVFFLHFSFVSKVVFHTVFLYIFFLLCVSLLYVYTSEDSLKDLVFSFYQMSPGDLTQVIGLNSSCF